MLMFLGPAPDDGYWRRRAAAPTAGKPARYRWSEPIPANFAFSFAGPVAGARLARVNRFEALAALVAHFLFVIPKDSAYWANVETSVGGYCTLRKAHRTPQSMSWSALVRRRHGARQRHHSCRGPASEVTHDSRGSPNHLISSGGEKRLRPMLTLAMANLNRLFRRRPISSSRLRSNFMHTATLLHDDVVDEKRACAGGKLSGADACGAMRPACWSATSLLGQAFSHDGRGSARLRRARHPLLGLRPPSRRAK